MNRIYLSLAPYCGRFNSVHAVVIRMSVLLLLNAMAPVKEIKAEESAVFAPTPSKLTSLPQNLLKLVHTPQVQQELGLTDKNLESFELGLSEIDKVWWPSRIKPLSEQRRVVEEQESKLIALLQKTVSAEKIRRLHQLELQSQGTRALARPELAKALRLTRPQTDRLYPLFQATDKLVEKASNPSKRDANLLKDLEAARSAEAKTVAEILTASQKSEFAKQLGTPFDTARLERVYPIAPELIDSGHWAAGSPTSIKALRGRVVLLHFYAFQCSNCIANFEHYKNWDKVLSDKGVSVLGIQTPETKAERDVEQVTRAAKAEGFQFPVLVDTDSKNWDAWGNTMWPTVYVIDKNGYIRLWWQGELNWQGAKGDQEIGQLVERLLAE